MQKELTLTRRDPIRACIRQIDMTEVFAIDAVAQIIRTAVTPVFLLVGISGLLGTLSGRLGRIIDRKRVVDLSLRQTDEQSCSDVLSMEARRLQQRIRLVNWSMRSFVGGALVVCLVIVALFLGDTIAPSLAGVIATLFMIAMLLLIAGLVLLLSEVGVATEQARDGSENCFGE